MVAVSLKKKLPILPGSHAIAEADCWQTQPGGGTVPIDKVVGRAFVIVWPLSRAGTLSIPDTFSQPGLSGSGSARG